MSKRDTDTEIWVEDWFRSLSDSEMLFWFFIKDQCDHAGFWRPNFKEFENITGRRINRWEFLNKVNAGKERVKELPNGRWFITGFISFHNGNVLNLKNHFHKTVYDMFRANLPMEDTTTYGFEVFNLKKEPVSRKKPVISIPERNIIPPTVDMVKRYCEERNNGIDPELFIDYYTGRNWKFKGSGDRMTDWQSTVRTWEKHNRERAQSKKETQTELLNRLEREGKIPRRPA